MKYLSIFHILLIISNVYTYGLLADGESFRVNVENTSSIPLLVMDSGTGATYEVPAKQEISIEPMSYDLPGRTLTIVGKQRHSSEATNQLVIPVRGGDLKVQATDGSETVISLKSLFDPS